MISKAILPWYGGTPNVWTICMLFFQTLLFGGYAYAHFSTTWLSSRSQGILHFALIAAALLMPVLPSSAWKPDGSAAPTISILLLLAVNVGLPFFVLASTSPLIQYWWNRAHTAGSPYRLYALSNAGSLAALLSYPVLVETTLPLSVQGTCWYVSFLMFCGFLIASGSSAWWKQDSYQSNDVPQAAATSDDATIPGVQRFLWIALAAIGSVMLLATTNHICHDIAVVPLLWVVPLALYLLTFILCFADCYPRWTSIAIMVILTSYIALDQAGAIELLSERLGTEVISISGVSDHFLAALTTHLFAMTVCCMVCHGEMARLKPPPRLLTSYYLHISFGGALGGLAVAIGAPLLLTGLYELPIGMILCWLLLLLVLYHDTSTRWYGGRSVVVWVCTSLIYCLFAFTLFFHMLKPRPDRVAVARNFYGMLSVYEEDNDDPDHHHFRLVNGLILHGKQYVREDKRSWPTTYYGAATGVGLAMELTQSRPQRRVGMVGLGTGTLAVYGEDDDYFRFYEIDENVVAFARNTDYFTFLSDYQDRVGPPDIIAGDARVSLEREIDRGQLQEFDLLVLDAFSSDAIPAHLLTLEAVDVYLKHLVDKPDRQGILAVHISNRYLDLLPIVQSAAARYDLTIVQIKSSEDKSKHVYTADWVLLSRPGGLSELLKTDPAAVPVPGDGDEPVWTDDYTNIFSVLEL